MLHCTTSIALFTRTCINIRVVNETYDAETKMTLRRWSDGIETRPRRSKNASRPRLQPWLILTGVMLLQTLREAKILTESREQEEEAFVESRKSNFGAQFDDFQGI